MLPNNIILTWKTDNIPKYVIDNIKRVNPDKEILFFPDSEVVQFLKKYYDSTYVDFFHSLKLGCTKGDFFRYCYLKKFGGFYSDIDIYHIKPISSYINDDTSFFSVISVMSYLPNPHLSIFQALLYCEAEHPVITTCIEKIMSDNAKQDEFYCTTQDMYSAICEYVNETELTDRNYNTQNGLLSLGKEVNTNYGFACSKDEEIIALSRYPNYVREKGFMHT